MASLLLPDDDPNTPIPLLQLPDERPPSLQPDPRTDALGQTYKDITDYMAQKQQESVDQGYWTGGGLLEGGHPTLKAFNSAVDAYAQGMQAGTLKGPGGKGFSLEQVPLRRQYLQPNTHTWTIKDPAGDPAGVIDTTFSPETGLLRIDDIQSEGGKNTLGPGAIRDLRASLLEQYPNATALSGQRITGAVSADRLSGAGPGREATQIIQRAPEPEPPSFNAYHGSPHLFEPTPKNPLGEFSDDMIGTGTGAQSEGMGHYTAGRETIGEKYRPPSGHMYEVKINADPDKYLHWDKPLSEQHPDVQKAFGDMGITEMRDASGNEMKGQDIYYAFGDSRLAADYLQRAGIPGVKYLDSVSKNLPAETAMHQRSAAEARQLLKADPNDALAAKELAYAEGELARLQKTKDIDHNYVTFDPANMEIIRRYGLAGLMLGGGLLSPDKQEQ